MDTSGFIFYLLRSLKIIGNSYKLFKTKLILFFKEFDVLEVAKNDYNYFKVTMIK